MNEDLSQNLRLLCGFYKSIAEVCRQLNISRPQFNRYLNGQYRPAAYTLKRICDFFGVEEHEILLPHHQFQRIVQLKPQSTEPVQTSIESEHLLKLKAQSSNEMHHYLGYYFEYHLSMASPGKILRNLVRMERQHDGVYYQRTERFIDHHHPKGRGLGVCHSQYLGMAYYLKDRIFMMDYESLTQNEVVQTILYPSFQNRVTRLHGLRMGAAASGERAPCSTRVMMEFLGSDIRLKPALALCGLYDFNATELDDSIRKSVENHFQADEWVFKAKSH